MKGNILTHTLSPAPRHARFPTANKLAGVGWRDRIRGGMPVAAIEALS